MEALTNVRYAAAAVTVTIAFACGSSQQAAGTSAGSTTATTTNTGAGGTSTGGAAASTSVGAGGHNNVGGAGGQGGSANLWQPMTGTTWQWQLTGLPLDLSYDVDAYDVDLFETTTAEVQQLKNAGRVLICYFSAGSWEPFRPDSGQFPDNTKGGPLEVPFGEERWLDIRSATVRGIIAKRLDLAVDKGCDAVEPDNVDGYANSNGLNLSAADQIDFNKWIAEQAHARGLSVGLKNDLDQLAMLEPFFDWALNEECFTYSECNAYSANFLAQGKAVFHAEYVPPSQLTSVCAVTKPLGLSTLIKNIDLDAFRLSCP